MCCVHVCNGHSTTIKIIINAATLTEHCTHIYEIDKYAIRLLFVMNMPCNKHHRQQQQQQTPVENGEIVWECKNEHGNQPPF